MLELEIDETATPKRTRRKSEVDDIGETLSRIEKGGTGHEKFLWCLQGPSLRNDHGLRVICMCSACAENAARPNHPKLVCSTHPNGILPEGSIPRDQYGTYLADGSALRAAGLGHLWRPAPVETVLLPKPYEELSTWLQNRITAKMTGKSYEGKL